MLPSETANVAEQPAQQNYLSQIWSPVKRTADDLTFFRGVRESAQIAGRTGASHTIVNFVDALRVNPEEDRQRYTEIDVTQWNKVTADRDTAYTNSSRFSLPTRTLVTVQQAVIDGAGNPAIRR